MAGHIPGGGGGSGANDFNSGAAHGGFPGGAGKVELVYTPAAAPANNVVRFLLFVPKHGGNSNRVLVRALTGGTILQLDFLYQAGGEGYLKGYTHGPGAAVAPCKLTPGARQAVTRGA